MAKHYLPNEYPEYKGLFASVIMHLSNGKRIRGTFHWEGDKPKFVADGSPKTSLVIAWEYE